MQKNHIRKSRIS